MWRPHSCLLGAVLWVLAAFQVRWAPYSVFERNEVEHSIEPASTFSDCLQIGAGSGTAESMGLNGHHARNQSAFAADAAQSANTEHETGLQPWLGTGHSRTLYFRPASGLGNRLRALGVYGVSNSPLRLCKFKHDRKYHLHDALHQGCSGRHICIPLLLSRHILERVQRAVQTG